MGCEGIKNNIYIFGGYNNLKEKSLDRLSIYNT